MPIVDISTRLYQHFQGLLQNLPPVPPDVEWLLPLAELPETERVFRLFLEKYYADEQPRTLILGINPGRFGGGITNVAFTDPVNLERECGIENSFAKRVEFSAQFVYQVIHAWGEVADFYRSFYVNSVVPFGFVKHGKNYNYYDEKPLQAAMEPLALRHLRGLVELGMNRKVCFCLGTGKNFDFLSKLNEREGIFEKVVALPHPRFVLQYRKKEVEEYVQLFVRTLRGNLT